MTGFFMPCSSTRLICSRILSLRAIWPDSQSAKRLGAVAALQQEPLAALGLGDLPLERLDFPRDDDRRQTAQFRNGPLQRNRIPVRGLLFRGS